MTSLWGGVASVDDRMMFPYIRFGVLFALASVYLDTHGKVCIPGIYSLCFLSLCIVLFACSSLFICSLFTVLFPSQSLL